MGPPRGTMNSQRASAVEPQKSSQKPNKKRSAAQFESEMAKMMERLSALEKENQTLKAQKVVAPPKSSGKRQGKRAKTVKYDLDPKLHLDEIKAFVQTEIWRETKFLGNEDELERVCKEIIVSMPEFAKMVSEDEAVMDENVEIFYDVYGNEICKALNGKRSTVCGQLGKAYTKRFLEGKTMPTPGQLKTVILRRDLVPREIPEGTEGEELAEIQAYNKEVELNLDFFEWYWECCLPTIVGKHCWGHSIRNYTTISNGTFPDDAHKKYITSSDEALVQILYENCGQRFPFSAKLKAEGVKELEPKHRKDPKYQSKYSQDHLGNVQWGGWTVEGRNRYRELRKIIACNKRKDHVYGVERAMLRRLQAKNNCGRKKKGKKAAAAEENLDGDLAAVSFIDVDSGDENAEDSDIEDADDTYQKPYNKDEAV